MSMLLIFIAGVICGVLGFYLLFRPQKRLAIALSEQLAQEKRREQEILLERLKGAFSMLSQETLRRSTEDFLKLARETLKTETKAGEKELEGKKKLIDHSLTTINEEMEKVRASLKEFEKERSTQYGALTNHLKATGEITAKLEEATNQLNTALASSRQRGQWGERMAEDVLRMAGFVEGIQYRKQRQMETGTGRPDFTFFLPQNLVLNMDVKFPLDNYMKYIAAESDHEKHKHKTQFLGDVRNRIKEVTTREYINPEEQTVDYVLVFIPNEQIYAFIWQHDPSLIDRALGKKVILCSPVTLLAVLAVIRQAVENFNLEQKTSHILSLLSKFLTQWNKYIDVMDKMGKRIDQARQEYEKLVTTRRKELERPLRKIDELRREKGITQADSGETGTLLSETDGTTDKHTDTETE